MRTPDTSVVRTVALWRGREDAATETHTMRMPQRLDTPDGREPYGPRVAPVEPVFANLRYTTRRDRVTRRGRTNGHGQWLRFCLVHHIEQFTHAGYAAYIPRWEPCARSRMTRGSRESLRDTSSQCCID